MIMSNISMVDFMIYKDYDFQEFYLFSMIAFFKFLIRTWIQILSISFRIFNNEVPVKSRKVSYLFVENFSQVGKDLRLPWMHHPGNVRKNVRFLFFIQKDEVILF
jgi:hypothetical protein